MSGAIRCPECGSSEVTCTKNPHDHQCHSCGYSMLRGKRVVTAAEAAGAVPDDVIEEVARAIATCECGFPHREDVAAARAAFLAPSVAAVFARDAKVRELDELVAAGATEIQLWRWESGDGWCAESDSHPGVVADGATPSEAIAALYFEDGNP